MNHSLAVTKCLIVAGLFAVPLTQAASNTNDDKIKNAMSAAPANIASAATIMDWPAKEGAAPTTIRKGTNGWTCFPDYPPTPGNDPMCLDKSWMVWMNAYMKKQAPKITSPGVAYMLQGGSDASNDDPFAEKPAEGHEWMNAPPHFMLIIPGKLDPGVFSKDEHSGGPWIMYAGTPYEHLMVPVK